MYLGQTSVVDHEVLVLDTSAWRMTSGRSPTSTKRTGNGATRGAQRDIFDARVDEQERHFWHNAAAIAGGTLQDLRITRLIIAGPPEATAAVASLLGKDGRVQVVAVVPAPPHATIPQLRDLTLQAALAEEHRRERDLVTALLERTGSRARAVVGPTATLEALARGQVHLVVVDVDQDAPVWQCVRCGMATNSERPVCARCGGPLLQARLLSVLPLLVRRYGADLEMVSGETARLLAPHDGIGAILRYNATVG
jgi:peptide subunit release factor 1 (eRF1)